MYFFFFFWLSVGRAYKNELRIFLLLGCFPPAQLPGVLSHDGIGNGERGHGLDDGDGAGHDAGVVAALCERVPSPEAS